jgi:hypothetical protein
MVWIFARRSRTHQIRVFHRRFEQLAGQEARREHKEASAHALEARALSEAILTVANHRLSCQTSTSSCGPFPPPQVSKMNPLCRLGCVGSITPRNRVP